MKIKEIEKKELLILCNDLLFKTIIELGQNKDANWFLVMSNSLANDLIEDFPNLDFQDIIMSFRQGVRADEAKFVVNVQTYYSWIKQHRQLIWDNESKEPERVDKRLKYRSRKNTGLIGIKKLLQ
jgi:hypothetical protein